MFSRDSDSSNFNIDDKKQQYNADICLKFSSTWHWTHGKGSFRQWNETQCYSLGFFYMHHPTDRTAHTTTFVIPVVEHWLEWVIAQWVHHDRLIRWSITSLAYTLLCSTSCYGHGKYLVYLSSHGKYPVWRILCVQIPETWKISSISKERGKYRVYIPETWKIPSISMGHGKYLVYISETWKIPSISMGHWKYLAYIPETW